MRKAGALKFWKHLGLLGLALNLAAFTSPAPTKDDLLELEGQFFGRSDAKFRDIDSNVVTVLKKGTRAVVVETKYFSDTKNYGLCLDVKNGPAKGPNDKCVWVYYDVKNPSLKLYSGIKDPAVKQQILDAWAKEGSQKVPMQQAASPAKAQAAETTRDVRGVTEKKTPVASSAPVGAPNASHTDAQKAQANKEAVKADATEQAVQSAKEAARAAVAGVDEMNNKQSQVLTTANQCPDGTCNTKIETYEKSCDDSNKYLEPALEAALKSSDYSAYFQAPQKEIISTQCIQRNLTYYGDGARRSCTSDGKVKFQIEKACISKNYVDVTAKSFNLAAECFGSTGTNSTVEKQEFALSVFSLMAQESGMHMNVVSPTGAAGAGQLTDDAINDVNQHLKSIRSQLAKSNNPNCTQTLVKAFEKPMGSSGLCERISAYKGKFMQNMAYSFAYQQIIHDNYVNAFFKSKTYDSIFKDLPEAELARLKYAVIGWGHNTGPGGIKTPFAQILRQYVRAGKKLTSAGDVDKFLKDMSGYVSRNNPRRARETSHYYSNIQNKMKQITSEPRTCLAN